MIKVYQVHLTNKDTYEAHKKNVSFGDIYLTVKEARLLVGTSLNENKLNMTIPWHSVIYMTEAWVEGEEPGSKPQPEQPKTKMWRMGKQEIVQEA